MRGGCHGASPGASAARLLFCWSSVNCWHVLGVASFLCSKSVYWPSFLNFMSYFICLSTCKKKWKNKNSAIFPRFIKFLDYWLSFTHSVVPQPLLLLRIVNNCLLLRKESDAVEEFGQMQTQPGTGQKPCRSLTCANKSNIWFTWEPQLPYISQSCQVANKGTVNNFPSIGCGWASLYGVFSFLWYTEKEHCGLTVYCQLCATPYSARVFSPSHSLLTLLLKFFTDINYQIHWLNLNTCYSLLQHFTWPIFSFCLWDWPSWPPSIPVATHPLSPTWTYHLSLPPKHRYGTGPFLFLFIFLYFLPWYSYRLPLSNYHLCGNDAKIGIHPWLISGNLTLHL